MHNMRWRRKRRWRGGMGRRLGGYGLDLTYLASSPSLPKVLGLIIVPGVRTRTHHVTISSRDNHDAHSTGNAEGEGREDREREREGERRGGKGGEMIRQTEGEGREESEIGEVKTNGLAK
jgi:hypothetical protein